MDTSQAPDSGLPTRRPLTLIYALSLVIALLMAAASLLGLLYRTVTYPADDLAQSFVPTDVVNLFIGLPVLLGSVWLARRGKLIGLLLWPGALLYGLYHYIVYVVALPLSPVFVLHLILLMLSAYTLIALIAAIDSEAVRRRLAGSVPERVAGGVLAGLGILFALRPIGVLVGALVSQTPVSGAERALHASDFVISPTWVIGGVLLWRRQSLGYLAGLGLLFQASMLFVGLVLFLLLQPFLAGAPFVLTDVLVILALGLVCFVPFALYVRGVLSGHWRAPK